MADAADFRRIALSFDGTREHPHFDRRAFKARVTFATLAPDELTANIKFAPDEQALKCAVAPDAFARPRQRLGPAGLDAGESRGAERSGAPGRARDGLAPWLGETAPPRRRGLAGQGAAGLSARAGPGCRASTRRHAAVITED